MLLNIVLMAFLGCTSVEAQSTPAESTVIGFSLPDTLMRVDSERVVMAKEVHLRGNVTDGALTGFTLRFSVDRKSLTQLQPPHFNMDLDPVALLSLDPARPVWITAEPRSELRDRLIKQINNGQTVQELSAEVGPEGFPVLLDLSNYSFTGAVQESAAPAQ